MKDLAKVTGWRWSTCCDLRGISLLSELFNLLKIMAQVAPNSFGKDNKLTGLQGLLGPKPTTGARFKMDQPLFNDEALLMQLKAPAEYDK